MFITISKHNGIIIIVRAVFVIFCVIHRAVGTKIIIIIIIQLVINKRVNQIIPQYIIIFKFKLY
jgi:multisubunit Na+/H+ antiporter MnhG subunit